MFWKKKNIINFYCLKCKEEFDCDVGEVEFPLDNPTLEFKNSVICEKCGTEYKNNDNNFSDKFELTELGQGQLTAFFFDC